MCIWIEGFWRKWLIIFTQENSNQCSVGSVQFADMKKKVAVNDLYCDCKQNIDNYYLAILTALVSLITVTFT